MEGRSPQGYRRRRGTFRARVAIVFGLQTAVVIIASSMAANDVAPLGAAIAIMLCSGALAWLAVSREWMPVAALARLLDGWDPDRPDMESLDKQGIRLTITDEAKTRIALTGFTPKYGARQISGVIRTALRRPISKYIVSGSLGKGDTIEVHLTDDQEIGYTLKK